MFMNLPKSPQDTTNRKAGFSLLEMLIVIGIIGMLAGLIIFNIEGTFGGAQESAAREYVETSMAAPLLQYRIHMGSYPTTEQGLQALLTPPADENAASRWKGPYVKNSEALLDPWQQPYQYKFPGERNPNSYDLFSMGPDQTPSEDDIGNWD